MGFGTSCLLIYYPGKHLAIREGALFYKARIFSMGLGQAGGNGRYTRQSTLS